MKDNNKKIKELAIMAMMVALLEAAKIALMMLPNIEVVSLLVVLFTLYIEKKVFVVVTVFSLIECILWGVGTWSIGYFYVWPLLVIITLVLKKHSNVLIWAVVLGFFGIMYGALFALTIFFTSGVEAMIAYWINGITFDIIHCVSNVIIALVLFKPMYKIINKLKINNVIL